MINLNIKELNKTVNEISEKYRVERIANNIQNFQNYLQSTLTGYLPYDYKEFIIKHIDSYGEIECIEERIDLEDRVCNSILIRLRKKHYYYKG